MASLFRVLAGPYRGAEEANRNGAGERPLRGRQGIWALVYLTWANGLPLPPRAPGVRGIQTIFSHMLLDI